MRIFELMAHPELSKNDQIRAHGYLFSAINNEGKEVLMCRDSFRFDEPGSDEALFWEVVKPYVTEEEIEALKNHDAPNP